MKTLQDRFEEKFEKGASSDCWEWKPCRHRQDYGRFSLAGRQRLAHRVSYQLYVGEITDGLHVLHKCDIRSCVNPSHLFLGTNADNMHDRDNKGRGVDNSGEKNGRAKLTSEQAKAIRTRRREGVRSSVLEKKFGVSQSTISNIVHYRTWTKI